MIGSALGAGAIVGGVAWRLVCSEFRVALLESEKRTQAWINGSFMRSGETSARLDGIEESCDARITNLEHRLDRLEPEPKRH